VQQQLTELNGSIKSTAEDALKQAKDAGEVSAATKLAADELLSQQTELTNSVKSLTEQLEGLTAQNLELSQQVAAGIGGGDAKPQSLGMAVVAEEEKIGAFTDAGCSGTLSITVNNAITSAAASAGGVTWEDQERTPVELPRRRLRIRQLLTQGRTGTNLIQYTRHVLRDNQAAPVAEEGIFPQSAYGWEKATAQVKKIGHITHISEEAMADADQLQTLVDSEMRFGLDLEEEQQILAGDGVGENLDGLIPAAIAFVAAAGLPNATRIDRLRLALLQLTLQDYEATAMLLSPVDWAAIEMLKVGAADGRYIFGDPGASRGPNLWGKPVVDSNSMTAGEWMVGDFQMAATYYDRQETEILISSEHGDNFIEDMLTMKGRRRAAIAHKRSEALVTGDFTFA
jgi:HK97 family phage major capsid protein